jgi:aminoglycoside 6'-N-acetyltransferase
MPSEQTPLPARIEAGRVYLRSYAAGDGRMYFEAGQRNRAHLRRYESGNAILSPEDEAAAETLVRELAADWQAGNCFFMGIFDRADDTFLGQVYVGPISRTLPEYAIGFFADVDHEGRGYVTEAVRAAIAFVFEHLDAQRVRMECDDTNIRSVGVAERCGLRREGHLRENKRHPDGTFTGTLYFGMLRSEFDAQRVPD